MMFFGNRRPRGYHHRFIYVDERKELLDEMKKRAERELKHPDEKLSEPINTAFHDEFTRRRDRQSFGNTLVFGVIFLALILILAFLVWLYL
jgi:hypothetical protein